MRKKILLVAEIGCLLLVGCTSIKNEAKNVNSAGIVTESVVTTKPEKDVKEIMPLPAMFAEKASDEMPDGDYSVSFSPKDLKKNGKGYELTMAFYDYDRYSKADIDALKKGDIIQVAGKDVDVESVEWNEDKQGEVFGANINGGSDEDGVSLHLEDGYYRTTSLDDFPVYYSIGNGTLQIAKDLTVQDCIDTDTLPDGIVTEYKDLPENLTKTKSDYWTQASTSIAVRDGKVVKIVRNWTP